MCIRDSVYAAGRDIFNKPIAALSALLLVTSFGFMYIGKAAVTDMTLVLTLTVAMMSFYRKKYYTAYLFCGLSLLVKGPDVYKRQRYSGSDELWPSWGRYWC